MQGWSIIRFGGWVSRVQGILGGYFANSQGFDKEICLAVSEHYFPIALESKVPKNQYSIALAFADKLDTLVGFIGINMKPTSSKDPYALRRNAIGLVRIIIEINKEFKIRDLVNYSVLLYNEQGFKFDS